MAILKPEQVLFEGKTTAGDLLVKMCRENINILAQAAVLKADQNFTLQFGFDMSAEDVLATLRAAGFTIEQPGVMQ